MPAAKAAGDSLTAVLLSTFACTLPNGNIVIVSSMWNNNAGAVTCLTPSQYKAGGVVVSAANSLVGDVGDRVGNQGVTVLTTGMVDSVVWNDYRGARFLACRTRRSTLGYVLRQPAKTPAHTYPAIRYG